MEENIDRGMSTLIVFIIGAAILSAAQSVVTTGLNGIMNDFHILTTTAQWVYSSFLLMLGVMIPLSAFIIRRFKLKTMYISSLIIFILGSLLSFVSPNIDILILSRVIQGFACGILLPVTQIVLFKVVPEEKWQIYMGLFGLIVGVVPALAPLVGGVVIDAMGWRYVFLILAIFIAILTIIAFIVIDLEFETGHYPLDLSSLFLCVVGCVGLMLGFSDIAEKGISNFVWVILPIVIGTISLIIFVKRQFSIKTPLLNFEPLKNKFFFFGTLFSAILYFTMCGLYVILPLFVQSVDNYSATTSGLVLFPATIAMILFNFVGPVLANKFGVRKIVILSCIFSLIGYLLMMTYNTGTSVEYMIATQIVRGIGAGMGLMPSVTWTIAVVSGDVEDGTAINNTIRQIIGAIGAAVASVLMAVFAGGSIGHNHLSVSAFNQTSLVMACLVVIMLIIAVLYIKDEVHDQL